jgi:hypothetical protein
MRFWNNLFTTKIDLVQDWKLCQHLFDIFQRRHVVKLQGILAQRSARVLKVNAALSLVFLMPPNPSLKIVQTRKMIFLLFQPFFLKKALVAYYHSFLFIFLHYSSRHTCSTTGKPTRSFATERVSLDSV